MLALSALAWGCSSNAEDADSAGSEDNLVATFDQTANIDLRVRSHILLVGDSDELNTLPLYAAMTKARRIAQLYPQDQIVLFVTSADSPGAVTKTGASVLTNNPFGAGVSLTDLSKLTSAKLVAALSRFQKIGSLHFFGHSSPFGALLEGSGATDRTLVPSNLAALASHFDRSANPYVTLNGCNGGATLAPALSAEWKLPVAGALTGSSFQVLMSDGRWYPNDPAFTPPNLTPATVNDVSFAAGLAPDCSTGACVRMKPQDAPYRGVWADPTTGFQYGLGHYKFFCNYPDDGSCAKGMATSLYSFPSTKPIDETSSEDDVKDVIADVLCNANKDPSWLDTCKAKLFAAAASGAPLSTMRYGTDYTHECDFSSCQQKLRCTQVDGAPQYGSCVWVSPACTDDQAASDCRPKNASPHTTVRELAKYLEGHRALQGN
jgi:hypothetical protein